MKTEAFHEIVEDRCTKIKLVLANKAKEYAKDGDRLHNFKKGAKYGNCTTTRALFGMMNKHLVSVVDIFDDIDSGVLPSDAMLEEKFGDLVNYLILGEACIKEQLAEKQALQHDRMVLRDVVMPVRIDGSSVQLVVDTTEIKAKG